MQYRPDIDGLRAVAVMAVIISHAAPLAGAHGWLSGGFIGVDIFFVLSGYLISTILLTEHAAGKFSLRQFYERRMRRILPALAAVTIASLPLAWITMDDGQLRSFGLSVMSLSVFSSNILFWMQDGYFAGASNLKPMLHTWSLAVEEQYYIFFPLLLMLCWRFKWALLYILPGIFLISLAVAQYQAYAQPSAGFFLLPARGWELLAGAIIAAIEHKDGGRIRLPLLRPFLPAIGMTLIIISLITFKPWTPHPSLFTFVPVLGTVLLIYFGGGRDIITTLLSSRPFVFTGLISYSLYLWHFPILAFARLNNLGHLPDYFSLWFYPVIFGISWITWRTVERPCRDRTRIYTKVFMPVITAIWVAIISAGFILFANDGFPTRLSYPSSLAASFDRDDSEGICIENPQAHTKSDRWYCPVGKETKNIHFALIGDSHAYSFLPVLRTLTAKNNMYGIAATDGGCPPLLDVEPVRGDQDITNCRALNQRIYEFVRDNDIKTVILAARWDYYGPVHQGIRDATTGHISKTPEDTLSIITEGLNRTIAAYRAIGAQVVILGQVPTQPYEAREIYKAAYLSAKPISETLQRYSQTRAAHDAAQNAYRKLFESLEKPGVRTIDMTSAFCDRAVCLVGTPNESFYHDDDHLSITGNQKITDIMEKIIQP